MIDIVLSQENSKEQNKETAKFKQLNKEISSCNNGAFTQQMAQNVNQKYQMYNQDQNGNSLNDISKKRIEKQDRIFQKNTSSIFYKKIIELSPKTKKNLKQTKKIYNDLVQNSRYLSNTGVQRIFKKSPFENFNHNSLNKTADKFQKDHNQSIQILQQENQSKQDLEKFIYSQLTQENNTNLNKPEVFKQKIVRSQSIKQPLVTETKVKEKKLTTQRKRDPYVNPSYQEEQQKLQITQNFNQKKQEFANQTNKNLKQQNKLIQQQKKNRLENLNQEKKQKDVITGKITQVDIDENKEDFDIKLIQGHTQWEKQNYFKNKNKELNPQKISYNEFDKIKQIPYAGRIVNYGDSFQNILQEQAKIFS